MYYLNEYVYFCFPQKEKLAYKENIQYQSLFKLWLKRTIYKENIMYDMDL